MFVEKTGTVEDCELDSKELGEWCFMIVFSEGRQAQMIPAYISMMLRRSVGALAKHEGEDQVTMTGEFNIRTLKHNHLLPT